MSAAVESSRVEVSRDNGLAGRLGRLIETECGTGSRVANFGAMEDGHAGLTFGFDVFGAAGQPLGSYVLKLAPIGVTRRGNTDVYRQAPLLRGLKAAGMPVPAVPWASPDDDVLGTPFIVMERLPGRVFLVWEPHCSFPRDPPQQREVWLQAARMLARLHTIDWQSALPDWEKPRQVKEELDFWTPLLRHAPDSQWLVGWLLMMSDAQAWDPRWRPVAPVSRDDLVGAYRQEGGPAWSNLDWYQALAHFRLGAIACLNVKLHRTGKRTDSLWERFASSIPILLARGIALARRAASG
jgi:aminoglycoside phosphotransferase (APT) family kinase protein